MKYIVTLNGKNYEVEVENAQATLLSVTDVPAPAQAAPAQTQAQPAPEAAASSPAVTAAGEAVRAPMPGTIVGVKVSQGSAVKKGQVLVVLEAMKMENEIVAPRDGTVAQILVSQGASVETNAVLAVLS